MQVQVRRNKRMDVEIPVTITTVLDSMEGAMVADLHEEGALIVGCGLDAGTRFQIEYMGQTVFAQSRWSEIDRMGVKFLFPLVDGPLYERLQFAKAATQMGDRMTAGAFAAAQMTRPGNEGMAGRIGLRPGAGEFGRRGG